MKNLLIILFLLLPFLSFSQNMINEGLLIITSSSTICLNGSYINQSNGSSHGMVDIDGIFYITGDITNNVTNDSNVFVNRETIGTNGTVILSGSDKQTINGSEKTIFENLTFNNSASDSSIVLDTNVTVEDICTFTDGVVATGSNYLILESTVSTNLLPATPTNASFVYGNLRRYIASNTHSYVFPVGKGNASTDYHRSDFINSSIDLDGADDYITCSVADVVEIGDLVDGNIDTKQGSTPIEEAIGSSAGNTTEWTFTPSSTISSGGYGVNLYIANLESLTDNKFCVIKRADGSTTYADWDTHELTTILPVADATGRITSGTSGYAQRTGFTTTFSKFAIGNSTTALPIELLNFTANWHNDEKTKSILEWTTASEINNDYFTTERCLEQSCVISNNWDIVVDNIPGAGNSNIILNYDCIDDSPGNDITYYRLKQTNYNGKYEYSDIVALSKQKDQFEIINIYPSPIYDNDKIIISVISTEKIDIIVNVFDNTGRLVLYDTKRIYSGDNKFSLSVNQLAKSTYTIQIDAVSGLCKKSRIFVK